MVSQNQEVMSACSEFTQNAWKKELCINCQRSRGEHSVINGSSSISSTKPPVPSKNSPVLAKRNSKLLKTSVIIQDCHGNGSNDGEILLEDNKQDTENDEGKAKSEPGKSVKRIEKSVKVGFVESTPEIIGYDGGLDNLSVESENKSRKRKLTVGFVDSEPEIIGYDGGFDNISAFGEENDETSDSEGSNEELTFTEEERKFILLALENTLWNSDLRNLKGESTNENDKGKSSSKEFEDVEILSLLKPNRFSNLSDCDAIFHRQCGTFPLRSKSSGYKIPVGGVFDESVASSSSSDLNIQKLETDSSMNYKSPISHSIQRSYSQPSSSSSTSSSSVDADVKHSSLERHKTRLVSVTDSVMSYKVVNVEDIIDKDNKKAPELPKKAAEYSAELKLSDDADYNDDSDSLEGFNPQIDLESSSAGMALVDLLNDVLARYSDGESFKSIEGHELLPEVVSAVSEELDNGEELPEELQGDAKSIKGTLKSKQFEEKIASLAASLDLSKQKGKKQAPPRPPTSPPPEPISPNKKTSPAHNIEPNFKMVPIGKPIIDHTAIAPPRKSSSSEVTEDGMDGYKVKVDNKSKKGITSFFRNILRRGRDSVDGSNEQGAIGESNSSLSSDGSGNQTSSSDKKSSDNDVSPNKGKMSPQMKSKVLPAAGVNVKSTRTSVIVAFSEKNKLEKVSDPPVSEKPPAGTGNGSPKTNKQEVLDTGSDVSKPEDKYKSEKLPSLISGTMVQTAASGIVKPPVAARPKPIPNPQKPSISPQPSQKEGGAKSSPIHERKTSTSSESDIKTESPKRTDSEHIVVRRRAKSPKRTVAPSRPAVAPKGLENRHSVFTKELEMRLSKNVDQLKINVPSLMQSKSNKNEAKKISAPPPPSSPTSPKDTTTPHQVTMETKEETSDQIQEDKPVTEKIELPTTHSRRSFLGKLGKGKSKAAPRPPQNVKRTKSITENTLQGSNDLQVKKIDASDISAPVLIAEMTTHQVVNRRNTITIGEDCSMISGGSTSSGSTNEKYDEWPEFSPLGSLENLYEPIVPNEPPPPPPSALSTQSIMVSSAPSTTTSLIPSEGYLEPVRSNTDSAITSSHVTSDFSHVTDNGHVLEDYGENISEERIKLLASQPIYEEINGDGKETQKQTEQNVSKPSLTVDTSLSVSDKDSQPVLDSPSPSQINFSSESEPSSASSTLNRPKPIPRKRPKKTDSFNSEQPYVAMNRPSIAIALNEAQLRDLMNQLTTMNLQTLRDIYTQYEKVFLRENLSLNVTGAGPLKWHDFDIYGKPVHASERCIVYNAKLKSTSPHCQLLLLHTKPDMLTAQHLGILKPSVIFTDHIPFSYLTEDFIKTSQLLHNLQNSANQSNSAKCYVAVGMFDITDSLTNHVTAFSASESVRSDELIECVLFYMLQILSAISHCLDHGFSLGEATFRDVFVITNKDTFSGNIVTFLPHQRSHDHSQVESVCSYLGKYLRENTAKVTLSENNKYSHGITKIEKLLQIPKVESLPLARSYVEFLLWGPKRENWSIGTERQSNLEPKLSMWLEKERTTSVHNIAKVLPGQSQKYSVKDFYHMKFLLKSSAVSLTECVHHHTSS